MIDIFNQKRANRRLRDQKDALQKPLSFIGATQASLFFTKEKIALKRALISTGCGYCAGAIKNFDKVIKSLLFLFLNEMADLLSLELLEL